MTRFLLLVPIFLALVVALVPAADTQSDLKALLNREIIGPRQAQLEIEAYLEPLIPRMPEVKSAAEWDKHAERLRAAVLERVVFRGEAAQWRDAKTKVEWLDIIAGGPGYRIRKLRYEVLPGMWIPALLYEPEKLAGKVPVSLAVNGHDGAGKAAPYKQIRCINQAKRGMLVLNIEWFGMGQLRTEGFSHARMNQLDLCGSSGLAPFYLAMKRGLDLLLAHENADPERVAVSGLSGGGWQTIFISALDTRVKLCNPVAGYSGFRTRIKYHKDLGDSEQTPCDLAAVADYTHLTAMLAPRAALLTFNSKDQCCFEAGYALPPLVEAAAPMYKLHGKEKSLRTHVNDDPGTHNYEIDNRQAFYRMLGDHFFAGDKTFDAKEIPCGNEVKTRDELAVELPTPNLDFNTLALKLSKDLPRNSTLPTSRAAAEKWQTEQRKKLREVLQAKDLSVKAEKVGTEEKNGTTATYWKLKLGDSWTVPVVELTRGAPKATAILVNDAGRRTDPVNAERLLTAGRRVLAVDPFYFGESRIEKKDWLFAILLASTGERPLGLQTGQLAALARWSVGEHRNGPVEVVAVGPRSSAFALAAAGLEAKAIGRVEMHGSLGSLKEIIEQNKTVLQWPELFCFGLLEAVDVPQLVALAAPRQVQFIEPSARAKQELVGLKAWYTLLGAEHDPVR